MDHLGDGVNGVRTLVISGASGFLGEHLVRLAFAGLPQVKIVPLVSPRHGGIDLTLPGASRELTRLIRLDCPQETALIHAAARVSFDSADGLLANAAMAVHVAEWARDAGISFATLVSSVIVSPAAGSRDSLYAIGKRATEQVWQLVFPPASRAIVRLAGVWGWQANPTLFWNRLLLCAAGQTCTPLPLRRARSRRNYISVSEAANSALHLTAQRMAGSYVAASAEAIDLGTFVEALRNLPESRLQLDWQDDGLSDEVLYTPSPELAALLHPFAEVLEETWRTRPLWLSAASCVGSPR